MVAPGWRTEPAAAVKLVAGVGLLAALVMNLAIGLICVGALLGAVAFVVWFQNRANLRQLDNLLRDKAQTGLAALGDAAPDTDGV